MGLEQLDQQHFLFGDRKNRQGQDHWEECKVFNATYDLQAKDLEEKDSTCKQVKLTTASRRVKSPPPGTGKIIETVETVGAFEQKLNFGYGCNLVVVRVQCQAVPWKIL